MITSGQVCATKTKQNKASNCIEIVWTFKTKIYFTLITVSVQSVLIGSWKFIGFEAVWKACDKSPTMQWNRIDIRAAGFCLFFSRSRSKENFKIWMWLCEMSGIPNKNSSNSKRRNDSWWNFSVCSHITLQLRFC